MREEHAREEKLLSEREHEFFIIDRLGLLLLIQKYYQGKRITFDQMKSQKELLREFEQLKAYFYNMENFCQDHSQDEKDAQ